MKSWLANPPSRLVSRQVMVVTCAALAAIRLKAPAEDTMEPSLRGWWGIPFGSRSAVKTGIGLVATMTALILGLITASAKSSFDEVNLAVESGARDVLTLDRI